MFGLAMAKSEALAFPASGLPITQWFAARGSVVRRGPTVEVFVGGTLIGTFDEGDQFARNAILVQLAEDPRAHFGRLADAFEITTERLRQLRRLYEKGGLDALRPGESGGQRRLGERDLAKLHKLFEQGLRPAEAQKKTKGASLSTVARAFRVWRSTRDVAKDSTRAESAEARTLTLPGVDMLPAARANDDDDATEDLLRSAPAVQHAGTWIMMAMLARLGLHAVAREVAGEHIPADTVRLAIDATASAFALGEHTLEGARRLRTSTARLLLRTASVPSAETLRGVLDDLGRELGAVAMHVAMVRRYLDADRALASGERGVFYVDNHLRPYTGKHVVRKGWRMQDKRVRPGVSDYYVHDEDGRPLFRIDVAAHDSLPAWLRPIVIQLRAVVGDEDRVLLAFDRGGAFPETMASLRDDGCEFVTYERAPYPAVPASAFTETALLDDDDPPTRFCESRTNLKKGRGRVRRISVLTAEGRQVNLLASSTLPAARLIEIMRGRWRQENAFKHGKERWGINHLDARKVTPVDDDEIIPNPARRRLDVARRAANVREGDARCVLARYDEDHPRHQRALRAIDEAIEDEEAIDALRPSVPRHARLGDTILAGKLVRHDGRRKLLVDTIRIACANAESDLAQMLAPHAPKPREAKRILANIFRAPGRVRVGRSSVTIHLAPAATASEGKAISRLFTDLSALHLTLPGDPHRRKLHFQPQID